MRTRRRSRRVGIVPIFLGLVMLAAVPGYAASGSNSAGLRGVGTTARYGDRVVDLTRSWEGAVACVVWPDRLDMPECFDTEVEMNRRIADLESELAPASVGSSSGAAATSGSSCTSYLRLYDGTYYTGAVLYLRGRGRWFNLADYGFDQRTSSYRIGACPAWFADWTDGDGSWYPTWLTEAYDQASTMLGGWDNDVSSVYIT